MRTFIALSAAFIFATTVFPAEQTWSGEIADSDVTENRADEVDDKADCCRYSKLLPANACQQTDRSGELARRQQWEELERHSDNIVDDLHHLRIQLKLGDTGERQHRGVENGDHAVGDKHRNFFKQTTGSVPAR